MKYWKRDDIEYGVQCTLVFDGNTEPPRTMTLWSGNSDYSASLVQHMRRIPHNVADGVTYVRPRCIWRVNPAMAELHAIQKDLAAQPSVLGLNTDVRGRRWGNPYNIPTECWSPAPLHYTQQRRVWYEETEDWMLFGGTTEGEAWLDRHCAERNATYLEESGFVQTDRPLPVTPPML